MSGRAALFLLAACALAQDQPARLPPITLLPLLTISHAAAGGNQVSPGSQVLVFATGPDVYLNDHARLRLELQLKDSPIVFTAALLPEISSQNQVRAALPEDLPLGEVHAYLLIEGQRKLSTIVHVVAAAPGIYTDFGGFGSALAHQYSESGAALNGLTHPAIPGQFVTLWATGLGATPEQAIVELAGRAITPEFSGRNPVIPGLDQINFRIPTEDTPLGCYIPVGIRIGDRLSKFAALSIGGNAGACRHPLPLNYSELSALEEGRSIEMVWFEVASEAPDPDNRQEVTRLNFGRLDKRAAFVLGGLQATDQQYYACPVQYSEYGVGYQSFHPDAGPPPAFVGPDGRQILLTSSAYGRTLRPPDGPFSTPGTWLLAVTGGADIAGFQQSFRVPPPVRLRNVTIRAGQDTTLTWDPSGYIDGDVMRVTLYPDVVCRVPAWAGQLTIPATLAKPAPLTFELEPHPATRPRFRVPRTDGTSMPGIGAYLYREAVRLPAQ